jgi:hypothetical protein
MGARRATAFAGVAAVAAVAASLAAASAPPSTVPPRETTVTCAKRSEANFPGAFADARNLVVGPLALVGAGSYTPASVVRRFGGNKFPLLVKAGHRVTLRLSRAVQRSAGLAYAGMGRRALPGGEVQLRDTAQAMTFVACRRKGASGSRAGAEQITFWSGFVMTSVPRCLALAVYVDGDRSPRRARIALGRRCPR